MLNPSVHVVTGAFDYSGKYITLRLLSQGYHVRTLTNSTQRVNPFGACVEAHPFNFDNPSLLIQLLRGVDVVHNTYWVRFNAADFKHTVAVENTLKLFEAAKQAGVKRWKHMNGCSIAGTGAEQLTVSCE